MGLGFGETATSCGDPSNTLSGTESPGWGMGCGGMGGHQFPYTEPALPSPCLIPPSCHTLHKATLLWEVFPKQPRPGI